MYEYVAVSWRTANAANDDEFVREKVSLLAKGWIIERCAPWSREDMPRKLTGGACIMRRPKDEPRKWTEGEIQTIFANWEEKTIRCQELQKRNEMLQGRLSERQETICALQAAVNQVLKVARKGDLQSGDVLNHAIRQFLYPFVTTAKEETNG